MSHSQGLPDGTSINTESAPADSSCVQPLKQVRGYDWDVYVVGLKRPFSFRVAGGRHFSRAAFAALDGIVIFTDVVTGIEATFRASNVIAIVVHPDEQTWTAVSR